VDLTVIIAVDFLSKDVLGWLDSGNVFSDAGSDKVVLKPTVGPLNLAFGLRREGISDFHIAILQDLFPLGRSFIGQKMVCSPEGIPSLDKPKDGMAIDIISERRTVAKDNNLEGLNMGPTGFFLDEDCIKNEATVIIQGSDEVPFLFGGWCPKMERGVMLNQFTGVAG